MMCCDNFDFTNNIRDQAMGSLSRLEHWTTAYAFAVPSLLKETRLQQSQLKHQIHLPLDDVITSFVRTADAISTWTANLLHRALDHGIPQSFRSTMIRLKIAFPIPTSGGLQSPSPASVLHFAAINANSGTIDGTYRVHQFLVESELGWKTEGKVDAMFKDGLQLMCGDQKTIEHIFATKIDQQDSRSHYDRRRWLWPVPGLFHVQMHTGDIVLRVHWAAPISDDGTNLDTRHCMLRDVNYLGYKGLSPERSPWHVLDPVITTCFDARVLAVWLQCLEHNNVVSRNQIITKDDLDSLVDRLGSKASLERNISMTEKILFSSDAQEGLFPSQLQLSTPEVQLRWPTHMTTLARYMQSMRAYLIFRLAIKHGDLRTIQIMLPFLTCLFLGCNKTKCARELIYLMWLLHPAVSDDKLRDAVTQSLLINTSGKKGSFIPLDRHMEHINKSLRDDINAHKNSTHDWTTILQTFTRISPYYGRIRDTTERSVEYKVSTAHTRRKTDLDVFNLAMNLWKEDQVNWKVDLPRQYECDSPLSTGTGALASAIEAFNTDVVDRQASNYDAEESVVDDTRVDGEDLAQWQYDGLEGELESELPLVEANSAVVATEES